MKRADELFAFDNRPSSSALVSSTWGTTSGREGTMLSVAGTQWGMVFTHQAAGTTVTVLGPETRAAAAPVPEDAEFFGIAFTLGTFMPGHDMRRLVDGAVHVTADSPTSFRLDGGTWEVPGPGNADVFVDRLVRAGLLAHDPVVEAALAGDTAGLSPRSVERRVARATGLTQGAIHRIRRADAAVGMLARGLTPAEVAHRAGYADQPHLTRSLKHLVGRTPAQLAPPSDAPAVGLVQDSGTAAR